MKSSLSIGRNQDNDIVLDHPQVSGKHAILRLVSADPPCFQLKDLGSTNGTFKNGEQVETCDVVPGDALRIANVDLDPALYLPLLGGKEKESSAVGADARNKPGKRVARAATPTGDASVNRSGAMVPLFMFLLLSVVFYFAAGAPQSLDIFSLEGNLSLQNLAGALLVAWALVQLGLWLQARLRRLDYEEQHQALELRLWENRVDAAQRRQALEEQLTPAGWKGLRKFVVERKVPEGGDICSFYLAAHDGKPLPPFKPGQYLTFNLKVPGQTKPVVRCYSLSATTIGLANYRVSIKRVPPPRDKPDLPPGLSSNFFHDTVKEGEILDLQAPSGHFFLDLESDAPVVLIGGGVGITPVLSMLDTLVDSGSPREVWFFYGLRNRDEHIMEEHLRMADQLHPNIHIKICYSNPAKDDVEGLNYQHGERVSVDLFKKVLPSNNYKFYICGPPPMMDSLTTDLEAWGVPRDDIHFEAFGPASAKKVSHGAGAGAPATGEFQVTFAKSDTTCKWTPDSGSLLELAEANGVALNFGCRAGNCGTCLVAVREGKFDYYHEPGVDPEEGSCLACIARPAGESGKDRLVLDA